MVTVHKKNIKYILRLLKIIKIRERKKYFKNGIVKYILSYIYEKIKIDKFESSKQRMLKKIIFFTI